MSRGVADERVVDESEIEGDGKKGKKGKKGKAKPNKKMS